MKRKFILIITILFSFCVYQNVYAKTCKIKVENCENLNHTSCNNSSYCTFNRTCRNKTNSISESNCSLKSGEVKNGYCYVEKDECESGWTQASTSSSLKTTDSDDTASDTSVIDNEYFGCIIGNVEKEGDFAYYLQIILNIMKYAGIVLCVVLTAKEFIQAMTENEKDLYKKIATKFATRMIYVILLFFLPTLVNVILMLIGNSGTCGLR